MLAIIISDLWFRYGVDLYLPSLFSCLTLLSGLFYFASVRHVRRVKPILTCQMRESVASDDHDWSNGCAALELKRLSMRY